MDAAANKELVTIKQAILDTVKANEYLRKQLPTIERTIFREGVKLYGQEEHSQIMV